MRKSLALWILGALVLVQFGLAHTAICNRLMVPPPAATHCHSTESAPTQPLPCHESGCVDMCRSLTTPWTFTAKAKAVEFVLQGTAFAHLSELSSPVELASHPTEIQAVPLLHPESPPPYLMGSSFLI